MTTGYDMIPKTKYQVEQDNLDTNRYGQWLLRQGNQGVMQLVV